jgi:gliding motility-associated-like protein
VSFNYLVIDPDWDSLFVTFSPDPQLRENLLQTDTFFADFKQTLSELLINADCDDVGDTIDIEVFAIDKGCPAIKDSTALIRVVVTPPPLVDPPETVCLNFKGDDEVRLRWDAIPESHYFLKTVLYRVDPSGFVLAMDSFFSTDANTFIDNDVTKPRSRYYTYYLVTFNKCDKPGPESYRVSSTKEFESPIDPSYLVTATVVGNKNVEVRWLPTTEADFGNYDIYRKSNSKTGVFVLYASTYNKYDTSFIDTKVDVQNESYCYSVVVNDDCGHVSRKSNMGCNIVLEGESVPWKHTLNWNPYYEWEMGVNNYELSRSVDTGSLWPRQKMNASTLRFEDTEFDYDWGGYWYEILAEENLGSQNALSRSNRVYLIQPPLLHVPNAFTANYDGLNEVWGIVPVFVKEYELSVFNRWGERVFHSTDKKKQWDGYYKGIQASNAVYIYTITYTGWDKSINHVRGTVTVLK